jgi:hypothetical protein
MYESIGDSWSRQWVIEIETWLGVFGNKEYLMEEIENGHSEFWKSLLNLEYISRIVPLYGNK